MPMVEISDYKKHQLDWCDKYLNDRCETVTFCNHLQRVTRKPLMQSINSARNLIISNTLLDKRNEKLYLIVNNTTKTFHIKRGSVVGTLSAVMAEEISAVNSTTARNMTNDANLNVSDINVPSEHKEAIERHVNYNVDLFAKKDYELGRTYTVKMKIDTGDAPPIKIKPYRTPLNNRKVIDDAVNEMLSAA